MPKRKLAIEIISALLILFFAHCGLNNFMRIISLRNCLAFYTFHPLTLAWIVVIFEGMVTMLLVIPRTRTVGFLLSALFMITLLIVVQLYPRNPHNFGGLLNLKTFRFHITFSLVGAAISFIGVWLNTRKYIEVSQKEVPPIVYT